MEFLPGHHRGLRLVNFTVFSDASFEFAPGVNVFVGENGTGKTHALKALYALKTGWRSGRPGRKRDGSVFNGKLLDIFGVEEPTSFSRQGNQAPFRYHEYVEALANESVLLATSSEVIHHEGRQVGPGSFAAASDELVYEGDGTFIPASDMLGHTQGFIGAWERFGLDYDLTHRDLALKLVSPALKDVGTLTGVAGSLGSLLGGRLVLDHERFLLETEHGKIPAPVLAEGIRKIATLKRLIETDNFAPGSVLYWDEPEVNLNPKLMDEVVDAILTLARAGVQVFLATHSYILLEEFRDRAEPGEVRYHGFDGDAESGVVVRHTDDLARLCPNPILEQYEDLGLRKIRRSMNPRVAA